MKKLTIIQHDDGKFELRPETKLMPFEVFGLIHQAELLHRLGMIDQYNANLPDGRPAADPRIGPSPLAGDYPPSWCNCGTSSDVHGQLCNIMRSRHKRPIEPDITGEAKKAVKGTAKLRTESNGKNGRKS